MRSMLLPAQSKFEGPRDGLEAVTHLGLLVDTVRVVLGSALAKLRRLRDLPVPQPIAYDPQPLGLPSRYRSSKISFSFLLVLDARAFAECSSSSS